MAKGYWIVRLDVTDPENYKQYIAASVPAWEKYGAQHLVRGGRFEAVEGTARSRNVVVAFKDVETARACWHSPEYQAAYAIRAAYSVSDQVIIEGYEGVQPAAGVIDGPASGPGTAYWIMRIDVHDPETYKSYIAADAIAVEKYKGWFLVRGGAFETVVGSSRSRNVLLAFKDYETALAAYHSPEYQEAYGFRKVAAEAEAVVIEGY